MKQEDRAKQFMPFAALTGLEDELDSAEQIPHYEETSLESLENEVDYGIDLNTLNWLRGDKD